MRRLDLAPFISVYLLSRLRKKLVRDDLLAIQIRAASWNFHCRSISSLLVDLQIVVLKSDRVTNVHRNMWTERERKRRRRRTFLPSISFFCIMRRDLHIHERISQDLHDYSNITRNNFDWRLSLRRILTNIDFIVVKFTMNCDLLMNHEFIKYALTWRKNM